MTTISEALRVGNVSETITVTGETPVVDIQTSTRRQVVLTNSVIASLPASRGYGNLLATVPGISGTGLDVSSNVSTNFFTARGGRGNEGTIQIDGMNVGSSFNGGGVAGFGYPIAEASEVQMTIAGGLGEVDRGGPSFNMIPKTGGNRFSGTGFLSTAGKWSQGNNLDDTLRSYGITEVPGLIKNWDTNFAVGGPIVKDRLWFYNNVRSYGQHNDIPLLYANTNAGNAASYFYAPNQAIKSRQATDKMIEAIRLTVAVDRQEQGRLLLRLPEELHRLQPRRGRHAVPRPGHRLGGPGSHRRLRLRVTRVRKRLGRPREDRPDVLVVAGDEQAPARSGALVVQQPLGRSDPRRLADRLHSGHRAQPAAGVPVGNFTYRGWASAPSNDQQHNVWRASATYVTGAHSMKLGYQAAYQIVHTVQNADSMLSYTFNNRVPSSFGLRIAPTENSNRTRYDAFYVQDQWTKNRLTLQGGIRYEHAWSWAPAGENGVLAPSRFLATPFLFPETPGVTGYHDITPRAGLAYDVFGNGKTSLKASFSKYLQPANNEGAFTATNPAGTYQATTSRTWNDANSNFTPDCGPAGLNSNTSFDGRASGVDVCGPFAAGTGNFGNANIGTQYNPAVLHGWGIRPVRLAVQRLGSAADSPPGVSGRGLQPSQLGQLLRHRQPRDWPERLSGRDGYRAKQCEPAKWWRLHGAVQGPQCQQPARRDEQLLHVRPGLHRWRTAHVLLARRGLHPERASGRRADLPGRHDDWIRSQGQLPGDCRTTRATQCARRPAAVDLVRGHRTVPDDLPRVGFLYAPED